jgi:orotidine-5'-phosphate decarboxylase
MVEVALARPHGRMEAISAREHLIVALDVATAEEALRIIDQLGDTVSFYKIGLHLQLLPELHPILTRLAANQKQVFLDFKYIDIPATVEGVVRRASNLGIKFITVMGQRHIVRAAVEGRTSDLKILAVTLLTGMSEEDMQKEYQTSVSLREFVKRRAVEAAHLGCDGVISSPNEIQLIRSVIQRNDFLIVTPGIRQLGSAQDDQKRTATPYDAIVNGANYLVVGRPIIRERRPLEAALRIIDEMDSALRYRESLDRSAPLPVTAEIY